MGLEVWAGWSVFLAAVATASVLGISGRLRFGEAVTAGMFAIPAGLGVGGVIDAARHPQAGALGYAIPALAVGLVGYVALGTGIGRKRATAVATEHPAPIELGLSVVAATAVTTTIAALLAKGIAGQGPSVWVAPSLTGIATFAAGSIYVDRARRRHRARDKTERSPEAVKSRTAIAVAIGALSASLYLSLTPLALVPMYALPVTIPFMWFAARRASFSGRVIIAFFVVLDLWPVAGMTVWTLARDRALIVGGGAALAFAFAIIFVLTSSRSARMPE